MAETDGRRLIPNASHLFFEQKDAAVLAWLEVRGWLPENIPALHEKLRAMGTRVVTGDETMDFDGEGDCWADGSATINATNQSGGYCRADGSATINRIEKVEV